MNGNEKCSWGRIWRVERLGRMERTVGARGAFEVGFMSAWSARLRLAGDVEAI